MWNIKLYAWKSNALTLENLILIQTLNHSNEESGGLHKTLKNGVFWDVTPCGSCKNRRFGGT
jgi:hypothetical protein